jgi:hypothetical protein
MKMLKSPRSEVRRPQKAYPSHRPERASRPDPKRRRKKKTKSLSQRIMSEIWDVAEDVFDDLFD